MSETDKNECQLKLKAEQLQPSKFCQSIIRHPVLSNETSNLTKTDYIELVYGSQNLNGTFNLTKTDEMFEDCFCAMSGLSHEEFDATFQDTNYSLLITVIEPKDTAEFSKYKIVSLHFSFFSYVFDYSRVCYKRSDSF